jgi:glycosyltransferase involved in cell wall biosynthesis
MSRILFFVPHPVEDAGYRYRIEQFIPFFEAAGHQCTIRAFSTATLYRALRSKGKFPQKVLHMLYCSGRRLLQVTDLARFDLVIIQREVFPFFVPLLESWVLFAHPRVIFALDDAVYLTQPNAEELNHPVLYKLKYGRGVETVMQHSKHVIAGNRILAEHTRGFNTHVSIIPTVVDCDRYRFTSQAECSAVTVGWVGSRSTVSYLKQIEPALQKLAANHPEARFRFIGAPGYVPKIPNCESLPFRLESELEDIASLDIGLMPLPDTEWARGKCAFKAIQYMASGVATVASPVGMASDLIQHDSNGLLATTNDEWFENLDRLVYEVGLRKRLAVEARRTIEQSYSLQVWGPKFADLISQLVHAKKQSECAGTFVPDS